MIMDIISFLRDSIDYVDNRNITDDYILGFGDEIIISVWGEVEQYEKQIIQRDGTVYFQNVGLLFLSGKNLSEAKTYIYNRFSKVYSTLNSSPKLSFLDVSIGSLKNINVTVSGHVNLPGNYVINPSLSLTNLLILSGGITNNGSLRKILISRQGAIVDSVDFYPLISGIADIKPIQFLDGDVIIIPPKKSTIALTGSIRIPAYYEFINDNLNDLLLFAGGKKCTQMIEYLFLEVVIKMKLLKRKIIQI